MYNYVVVVAAIAAVVPATAVVVAAIVVTAAENIFGSEKGSHQSLLTGEAENPDSSIGWLLPIRGLHVLPQVPVGVACPLAGVGPPHVGGVAGAGEVARAHVQVGL